MFAHTNRGTERFSKEEGDLPYCTRFDLSKRGAHVVVVKVSWILRATFSVFHFLFDVRRRGILTCGCVHVILLGKKPKVRTARARQRQQCWPKLAPIWPDSDTVCQVPRATRNSKITPNPTVKTFSLRQTHLEIGSPNWGPARSNCDDDSIPSLVDASGVVRRADWIRSCFWI
jgi:hypothetical protein